MKTIVAFCLAIFALMAPNFASAYTGELGTFIPGRLTILGATLGAPRIRIEPLTGVTPVIPMVGTCTYIEVSSTGMGTDNFNTMADWLIRAKTMELRMRFYAYIAHGNQPCEADYIEVQ